jgi:dTDP-4-amino-4,6-dideoxygalactose transaminase
MSASLARPVVAVPFLDLRPSHDPLKAAILADIGDLIDSNAFSNGPQVASFERAFADWCGAAICVGAASGLDALRLALLAAGVGSGDEVVVPAMTFIATWEAVSQVGATPIVVDISEADYNVDLDAVEASLSSRTRSLMPVHLYGQLADMRALSQIARRRELFLLEDAAQAHGASRDGVRAGTAGDAAGFSFYPGKNLGAFGDAGALVTGHQALADLVRALREHGQRRKYEHDFEGYTARLDSIQALVLERKLSHLDAWNADRRRQARAYTEALAGVGDLILPAVPEGSDPVWHLFVVRTADPAALSSFLAARDIGSGRHYPQPPHLSAAYQHLGHRAGAFPVAEAVAASAISLPVYPGLTDGQLEAVVEGVSAYFAGV